MDSKQKIKMEEIKMNNELEIETLPNLEGQTKAEEGGPIQDPEQNPLAEDQPKQPKKISAWTILLAIAATVAMLLVVFAMFVLK